MSREQRYFENPYKGISPDEINLPELNLNLRRFLSESIPFLEYAIDSPHDEDMDLYTGKVGIALSLWRMRRFFTTDDSADMPLLTLKHQQHSTEDHHHHSHHNLQCRGIGFTCDAICYHLYYCLSRHKEFDIGQEYYHDFTVLSDGNNRRSNHKHIDNELLNGRAGLALMIDYFQSKGMRIRSYHNTCPLLIERILREIDLKAFPWSWHEKVYYGAAHGTVGILHALARLGSPTIRHEEDTNATKGHCSVGRVVDAHVPRDDRGVHDKAMLRQLVHNLIEQSALRSGNFKSSAGSTKDSLVQWCHGAPGFTSLLLDFYDEDPRCQALIPSLMETVWDRGLLTKGSGICHGIAGNAYTFLAIYKKTLDKTALHRAICFALAILKQGPGHCCADADHPYSLFEGLAGTVQFVMDLLQLLGMCSEEEIKQFEFFDGLKIF